MTDAQCLGQSQITNDSSPVRSSNEGFTGVVLSVHRSACCRVEELIPVQ